jgi:ribosomal protein S18 acetylase RimI-like enzyme
MIVVDWKGVPAPEMARLYATESARWTRDLSWDTTSSWPAVELARTTWGLPGLVCLDLSGQIRGWTFYLTAEERCDVGGLVAETREATAALVDELVARAGSPRKVGGLMYAAAPDVLAILASRGIARVEYSYRFRLLDSRRSPLRTPAERVLLRPRRGVRAWTADDIDVTAGLLHATYGATSAPIGTDPTPEGWRTYVTNLANHNGCGTLSPAISRVLTIDGAVAAVALVSAIGPQTAHLVQLAVAPAHQGAGIGRALLTAAVNTARAAGHTGMSLLVAQDNAPALRLYQQAGFVGRGVFAALGAGRRSASDRTERTA